MDVGVGVGILFLAVLPRPEQYYCEQVLTICDRVKSQPIIMMMMMMMIMVKISNLVVVDDEPMLMNRRRPG